MQLRVESGNDENSYNNNNSILLTIIEYNKRVNINDYIIIFNINNSIIRMMNVIYRRIYKQQRYE